MEEKLVVNEAGRLGAAMTIINADIGPQPGGNHLPLILQRRIGLHDGDGEVPGRMRLQVHRPQQSIPIPPPKAPPHLPATPLPHPPQTPFSSLHTKRKKKKAPPFQLSGENPLRKPPPFTVSQASTPSPAKWPGTLPEKTKQDARRKLGWWMETGCYRW